MSKDLIDREALREDLRRFFPAEVLEGIEPKTLFAQIMHDIDNAPTVEYPFYAEAYQTGYEEGKNERPKGEWVLNKDKNPECPFCHHSFTYWGNFCGNCGAKMEGGAV